jgi:putative hemolysin
MGTLVLLGIIIAFLLAGFFAGVEVGFVSLNRLSVELRKKQKSKSAILLSGYLEEPAKFISAMIVGIIICLTVYGLLVDELLVPLWKTTETYLSANFIPYFQYIRILFDLIIATSAFLIYFFFCRAIFSSKSDTLMYFLAPLLSFFYKLFYPIAEYFFQLSEWIL